MGRWRVGGKGRRRRGVVVGAGGKGRGRACAVGVERGRVWWRDRCLGRVRNPLLRKEGCRGLIWVGMEMEMRCGGCRGEPVAAGGKGARRGKGKAMGRRVRLTRWQGCGKGEGGDVMSTFQYVLIFFPAMLYDLGRQFGI